ncbi:hypothetical protein NST17_01235 [Caldifermentibacillus hisashii]|uniref:Uncharacterized protein n=1 Tax=Caldifermentibacillus hisashii TaxID=996558 RepID=A0ABU9JSQ2_9BACI
MGEVLVLEKRVNYAPGTDYDALWKKIISELFEEFILSLRRICMRPLILEKELSFSNRNYPKSSSNIKKGKELQTKL